MDFAAYLKALLALLGGGAAVAVGTVLCVKWLAEKWLERRFESHKAELGRLTEQLKHGLEREMLKAELSTSKAHQVYRSLYEKIVRAHGAVSGLVGLGFASSYEGCDAEDFKRVLERAKLSHGESERILRAIETERRTGVEELQRALRQAGFHNAQIQVLKAKNYQILKALDLSPSVQSAAGEITTVLWNAWVDTHTAQMPGNPEAGRMMKDARNALRELESKSKLKQLEQLMRKELQPRELQPPSS